MKERKNDKKQVIVLGALVVVILGVGAFQFVGGSSAPAETVKKEASATEGTEATAELTEPVDERFLAPRLDQRDPFLPQVRKKKPANEEAPKPQVTAQATPPSRPLAPMPALPPMQGDFTGMPQQSPQQNSGYDAPTEEARPSFRLSGIVLGDRPVALIQSDDGKQKAVRVGDQVSGHKVASIGRKTVVLISEGERVTLTLKR